MMGWMNERDISLRAAERRDAGDIENVEMQNVEVRV